MANPARSDRPRTNEDAEIVLGVLTAVHDNQHVTQRSVARELDIALGLANAYLKRCVRKGLIKVSQAPARRYAYYLTPKGFSEKSRLTARYLAYSFSFFRNARAQCAEILAGAVARGWTRIALAGTGDLAEVAMLCARDFPIEVAGVFDPAATADRAVGLPVARRLVDLGAVDGVIVTDVRSPQRMFDELVATLGRDRVFAPELLRLRRSPGKAARARAGA